MGLFNRKKKDDKPKRFIKKLPALRRLSKRNQNKVYLVEADLIYMGEAINSIPINVKAKTRKGAISKVEKGLEIKPRRAFINKKLNK